MKKVFAHTFNLIRQRLTSNAEIVHHRVVQPAVAAAAAAQWLRADVRQSPPFLLSRYWLLPSTPESGQGDMFPSPRNTPTTTRRSLMGPVNIRQCQATYSMHAFWGYEGCLAGARVGGDARGW